VTANAEDLRPVPWESAENEQSAGTGQSVPSA
jgi:hypothetical protein